MPPPPPSPPPPPPKVPATYVASTTVTVSPSVLRDCVACDSQTANQFAAAVTDWAQDAAFSGGINQPGQDPVDATVADTLSVDLTAPNPLDLVSLGLIEQALSATICGPIHLTCTVSWPRRRRLQKTDDSSSGPLLAVLSRERTTSVAAASASIDENALAAAFTTALSTSAQPALASTVTLDGTALSALGADVSVTTTQSAPVDTAALSAALSDESLTQALLETVDALSALAGTDLITVSAVVAYTTTPPSSPPPAAATPSLAPLGEDGGTAGQEVGTAGTPSATDDSTVIIVVVVVSVLLVLFGIAIAALLYVVNKQKEKMKEEPSKKYASGVDQTSALSTPAARPSASTADVYDVEVEVVKQP